MTLTPQRQTILVGDCVAHMAMMDAATVDVVVTSPPYNLGLAYRSYDDQRPRSAYLAWLHTVGAQLVRLLKPDGSLFLNLGSSSVDPWLAADAAAVFRALFTLQNHIVWIKALSIHDDSYGHYKPINSPRFLNHTHEAIYQFTHTGHVALDRLAVGVPFTDKSNIARRGHAQDKRCAGDVWYIGYETVQSRREKFNHPAGFPVELARRCLRLHGVADALVLDPFAGTGTTLVAAAQLGHRGVGIELDPGYADTAQQRLAALP